ncbi:MAG: efflux RND transporter periplasmic adaptor subunit [Candidatus Methylomirabilia bacterium]
MHQLRKTAFVAIPCLLIAGLLLAGCGKPKSAGPPPSGPPEVGVVTIQPQQVAVTTELVGHTSAYLVAEVRPQVSGIVQERLFTEGGVVKAGDVLYRIDPASYQTGYDSAQAALARAKAAHASAQAALAGTKTAQDSARAARSRAEANAVPRRLKADRFTELAAINAVSRQDADDATAAVRQSEAEIQSAEAAIGGSAAESARAEAAVLVAEADIAGAEAALEAARINLARTKVTAPISGRIGVSAVTTGALVTANQTTALATIQQLDQVYVDVSESSANLLRLRQNLASGQLKQGGATQTTVRLVLENGAAYPLAGTLKFSDVTVQPGTGSVTLRSVFPNPDQLLLPGMFVRAIIQEGASENAILVPQRGVSRDAKGEPVAMVVGAGEKVEPRTLKLDRALGDQWLVAAGLTAGDRVILEGLQRVRPGAPVQAVPFGSAPAAPAPGAPQAPAAGK